MFYDYMDNNQQLVTKTISLHPQRKKELFAPTAAQPPPRGEELKEKDNRK